MRENNMQGENRIEIVKNELNFRGEMDYGSPSTGKKTKLDEKVG